MTSSRRFPPPWTWCLLHHAQNPKDNYYDHYGQDEPDDTAHLIIPSEARWP